MKRCKTQTVRRPCPPRMGQAHQREEQQTAIDHIEEVYYHTNDTRFIPLAATYLKDKAFLNEYID